MRLSTPLLMLVGIAMTVGCNSVLGIPERDLLAVDDGAAVDSTLDETFVIDTGADTAATDSEIDSTMVDSSAEAAPSDSTLPDTLAVDALSDSLADSAKPDTLVVDSAKDTSVVDTAMPDTAPLDTAVPDTSVVDMGVDAPSCGVAGSPCCGAIPASCNTNAACNQTTKACVAAAGACVRASDCGGSACGGPSSCAGNICFACTPTFGSKAFGAGCTSAGECASGVCDTFRGVCSGACSNGITADADCTTFGAKVVCSELTYTITGASGKIGFCALGCDRDADCAAGTTCSGSSNEDANRVDLTCGPPRGSTAYGAACTTPNDCIGGSCITFGASTLCTPFCASSADCPAASPWKNCSALTFSRPKGGTQPIKMCTP